MRNKKLVAILTLLCFLFTLMPISAFAAADYGLSGIVKPWDDTLTAGEYTYEGKYTGDYVYMGKYKGEPIKWRVLAEPERVEDTLLKRGVDPNVITNRYLMISDEILDNIKYDSDADHYTFNKSEAQEWSNNFLADSFSDEEKAVIKEISDLETLELDYNAATAYVNTSLRNVKMFFPSAQEVVDYMPDARDRIAYYNGTPAKWWLRDTASNKVKHDTMIGNVLENGLASSDYATNTYGVRPAFYLDWTQVAYLVPANNSGVINFGDSLPNITREWKPVLKNDIEFSGELSGSTLLIHGYENAELVFTHPMLSTYNKGYTNLMASLTDNNGMLLYYGIIDDNVSDTAQINIPVGLDEGKYTLSIFPAVINGEKEADYIAGTCFEAIISVDSNPVCVINETNFPDEEFRYYVSRYVDTNESGSLSEIEIANCTSMNLDDRGIAKLDGIEFFKNLKYLYLRNNKLEVVDLSDNIELAGLYCDNNSLTKLDLTANVNLETLNCSDNKIDDIKINNNIKYLTFVNNKMSFLDVSDDVFIIAYGQKISREMNASRQIDMSEIVSDASRIEMVSGGSIEDGKITVNKDAKQIVYKYYCSNAKNNYVEVTADVTYQIIGINEAYFPDSLFREYVAQFDTNEDGILSAVELAVVEWISLDDIYNDTGSKVTDLTGIEHFTEMTELHCANNALTTLDLSKNTKLEKLYCVNNELVNLDLSKNTELKWLYCAANNLTELDISNNNKLVHLDAGHNRLEKLDLSQNTMLDSLGVGLYSEGSSNPDATQSNMLTELDLTALVNLTYLDASGNQLTSIDLSENTKLSNIDLSYNHLAGVGLGHLTDVENISLEGNTVYVNVPNNGSIALSDIGITADKIKEVLEPAQLMGDSIVLSSDGTAQYRYDTGFVPSEDSDTDGEMSVTLVSHTNEDHIFSDVYEMNSTRHWKYCTICGAKSENEVHSYNLDASNNNETHTLACECGMKQIEKCVNINADCVNLPTECSVCGGYCAVQSIKHRGPFISPDKGNLYVSVERAGYVKNLMCDTCGEDAYKGVSIAASYSERSIAVEFDKTATAVIVEKVPGTSVVIKADDIRAIWETKFTDAQKKAVGEAVVIGGVSAGITARGSDGTSVPISDLGGGTASIYMPIDTSKLPVNWNPEKITAQYIGEDGTVERVPVKVAVSTAADINAAFKESDADSAAKITSPITGENTFVVNPSNAVAKVYQNAGYDDLTIMRKLAANAITYAVMDVNHFSDYVILYGEAVTVIPGTTPSTNSGGGFSGSYNYPVVVADTDGADVTLSEEYAIEGETVTITVTPESGKQVDEVIVTDEDGEVIAVTKTGDNTYTFTMPEGKVNVLVTTKAIDYDTKVVLQIGNKNVVVNNKTIVNDVAPLLQGDRTLVPIRVIIEALGGSVDWNEATRTVTITIDGKVLTLVIDKEIPGFGQGATIMDNRTYVPIRYVAEYVGAHVEWIAESQQIVILK